ncbi:DUF2892 domain-containing protein [Leadbetterella sp. DM7]|uniref:YgaP family membrane protein n=1 Tax=Leadbetterella sp. DM7 TaxID=3235085 RepID=UPI00349E55A8
MNMKREHIIRMIAGILVLTGALLSHYLHPNWIWLCVFVGGNLLQSSLTQWCPLEKILEASGMGK